jgi:uncharacterized membrane protein YhdT
MSVVVPQLRFDEENSPSAVWGLCSISVLFSVSILALQSLHIAPISAPGIAGVPSWFKWMGYADGITVLTVFTVTIQIVANCIYHPIPYSRRNGFIALQLGQKPTNQ